MLGRTHMAIGALGAAVVVPMLLNGTNAHAMLAQKAHGTYVPVEEIVAGVLAGALGGILPDLDQKDSLMSQRVERIGQAMTLLALVGLLITLHLWMSPLALVSGLFTFLTVVSHAEWMRKASLLVLAVGSLGWGWTHRSWMEVSVLLAVWLVVTTFSAHRTFTHSLVGLGIMGGALMQVGTRVHLPWLAETALLGYVLHMAADAVAGGIPLFWPYKKRQGVRLVKTGGMGDNLVGSVCTLLFLVVVFV